MTPAVVSRRVDALTLAFRATIHDAALETLRTRHEVAKEHGCASVKIGRLRGKMKFSRAGSTWNIGNDDVRVRVDLKAPGGVQRPDGTGEPGWTVEVVWTAAALATMPDVGVAVRAARALVDSFAHVHDDDDTGERVRRIDLCADVAGWQVERVNAQNLVRRPRCKVVEHPYDAYPDPKPGQKRSARPTSTPVHEVPAAASLHGRKDITGISVSPGGAIMARLYDKREELRAKWSEGKTEAEEGRWREGGWDGDAPVTRVEFQIRGEAIAEFGARNPRKVIDPLDDDHARDLGPLEANVDAIWQRCLEWVRLTVDHGERKARRKDDPRWRLLRQVTFVADAPPSPAARKRWRGGASIEQALGCALSVLGARGVLSPMSEATPTGTDAGMENRLYGQVEDIFRHAAIYVAGALTDRWGPKKALEHVATVYNATHARFLPVPWSEHPHQAMNMTGEASFAAA